MGGGIDNKKLLEINKVHNKSKLLLEKGSSTCKLRQSC